MRIGGQEQHREQDRKKKKREQSAMEAEMFRFIEKMM